MINEIEVLFKNQIQSWPRLARGVEGLSQAQTRPVRVDWFEMFVRHIPHRAVSTTAAVDPQSIAKRPCFLCAGNLDPEEKGISFGDDYIMYFNPFPIVERHLSIVHREHGSQHIAGEIGRMLDIAFALPGYFVIYNGPQCGASAPDHMHFQAGLRSLFPIEKDTEGLRGIAVPRYARNVFVFRGSDHSRLVSRTDHTIGLLADITNNRPEPLINIAAFHSEGCWTVYLFPRGKHRPDVYYTGELTVSPGTIDLCGIFVTPFEKDFAKVTGEDIAKVFREVTLPDAVFEEVVAKL
jgi:hypothetical protein